MIPADFTVIGYMWQVHVTIRGKTVNSISFYKEKNIIGTVGGFRDDYIKTINKFFLIMPGNL
jgi:hypothetical protein